METEVHIDRVEITVNAPQKPLFLTVQQAAEESALSTSYIRKLIQSGHLRISVKITTGSGRKLPRIRSAATLVV